MGIVSKLVGSAKIMGEAKRRKEMMGEKYGKEE
jgi:hypothetical protein